jgi:hypothetical protein
MAQEVYSIWKCAFCKPIKKRPYKEALAEAKQQGWDIEKMGSAGQNMNPLTCPYTYVRIDDQFYKRDTGNCHDDMEDYDYEGIPCHDCGVLYKDMHHVSCDMERCPVPECGNQFLSCPHSVGAVYYKGLGDSNGTPYTSPIWTIAQDSFNNGNDLGREKDSERCFTKAYELGYERKEK